MTDVTPNEARMPEDAAVTRDQCRYSSGHGESDSYENPWNVAGEWRADRGKHQRAAWRGSGGHQLSLGVACTGGTGGEGEVS